MFFVEVIHRPNGFEPTFNNFFLPYGSYNPDIRIDEIQPSGSSGDRSIQPSVKIQSARLWRDISHIYIDIAPLAALRFMTGDGIGVFHLQRIEIRV